MGRDRFTLPQGADDLALSLRQLSPEAREVASRTYVAGRADACCAFWACWTCLGCLIRLACLACLLGSRAAAACQLRQHTAHPPSCLLAHPCCPTALSPFPTSSAGVRSLIYGSLLGALGLAAAITYATRSLDVKSGEELGQRMRDGLGPVAQGLRAWLVPFKERTQAWLGPPPVGEESVAAGAAAGDSPTAELSRRLQSRFAKRSAAGKDGGGGDASAGAGI
jgi:hypothetical protein